MNSRNKGKYGELELSRILRGYGFPCRRSVQYCGSNGDADIVGIPGLHIECKRVEQLSLKKAMEQSAREAKEGEIPVVIHRKNRQKWQVTIREQDLGLLHMTAAQNKPMVTMPLDEFMNLLKSYLLLTIK